MSKKKKLQLEVYRAFSFDMLMFQACQLIFLTQVRNIDVKVVIFLESFFWYLQTFLQVPGVLIVEKLGNKKSTVLGSILWCIAICIYIIPSPIVLILVAEIARAIGLTMKSIVDTPIIYKTAKEKYSEVEGNGIFLYFIIDMVCATSSGYLFNVNEYIPMICCLGICIISLLLALQIEDVPLDNKQGNIALDFKEIFKSSFVWSLFAYSFIMCGVLSLPETFNKVYMQDIGIPVEMFGIILGILSLINAISAKYNEKIANIFKEKTIKIITITAIISYGILGGAYMIFKDSIVIFAIIIPIFIIQNSSKQPYRIYMKKYINEKVEEHLIPKTLSIYFLIESLGRAGLLFVSGILTGIYNIGGAYFIMFFIIVVPTTIVTIILQKNIGGVGND